MVQQALQVHQVQRVHQVRIVHCDPSLLIHKHLNVNDCFPHPLPLQHLWGDLGDPGPAGKNASKHPSRMHAVLYTSFHQTSLGDAGNDGRDGANRVA